MRTFDLTPLLQSAIGFDDIFRWTDNLGRIDQAERAYPPYNIEKTGENEYRISMALAGFGEDDLSITLEDDVLSVSGKVETSEEGKKISYLHQGIARRAFERKFQLADTIRVTGADFTQGLLNISLEREIPEHKKPRQIEIRSPEEAIEGRKAA